MSLYLQYEVITSRVNSITYPSNMLLIQKSTTLEIGLLTCATSCVNRSVHSTTPLRYKLFCRVANSDNLSYNTTGNSAKKISWISEYRYCCNQFLGLSHKPSLSFCTNIDVFDSSHSSTSLLVGCHNISLILINKVPAMEPFFGHFS